MSGPQRIAINNNLNMKHFFISAALTLAVGSMAMAAPAESRVQPKGYFPYLPKVGAEKSRQSANPFKTQVKGPKIEVTQSDILGSLPTSDESGYLYSPQDEIWFYTLDLLGEIKDLGAYKEKQIEGFKLTVYDSQLKPLGTVQDTIRLEGNETKIAQLSVGPQITQKFFNFDNKYEVMIGIAVNTSEYVNHYRTQVYSLDNNNSIASFGGYYVSAINTATESWNENFYITFMTEEDTTTPDVNGVLNAYDMVFKTYRKAGYSGMGAPVIDARFPQITTAGPDANPFLATVHDGIPYFAVSHLKYSWFEDPYDMSNENPTPDNELIVDLYAPATSFASTVDKYSTTTFKSDATASNLSYLYIGAFSYNNDINFTANSDGKPSFYITRAHVQQGGDSFLYDFELYDAAAKGTDAQGTDKRVIGSQVAYSSILSDIPGFPTQVMFISADNKVTLVDALTGTVEHQLPLSFKYGDTEVLLNANLNRVANGKGYLYAIPQTRGTTDAEGNTHTGVAFIDPETATVAQYDDLNLGKNVDYANIYAGEGAYDPYLFNLDVAREYMVLVKRRVNGSEGIEEQLVIVAANSNSEPLLQLGPDAEKGTISNVSLVNINTENPLLCVFYLNRNPGQWTNVMNSYSLPLALYEQGDGSVENPYVITTVGGLDQIRKNPNAYYILGNDIDASGMTLGKANFTFGGCLDGRDKVISNLTLEGGALFPTIAKTENSDTVPTVCNISLLNPVLRDAKDNQGIIAGNVTAARIANVHIYNGSVKSENDVAGIAGRATLGTAIESCSFQGSVESAEGSAGGIVVSTLTDATVKACAVKGAVKGSSNVGGIAGELSMNGGPIVNCHVNAAITAKNTVGGIAGSAQRKLIAHNHIQGTITATEPSQWGGGAKAGGVVGALAPDFGTGGETGEEPAAPSVIITQNFVDLSSITAPEPTPGNYPTENTTVHRIVGYSSANVAEEIGYDETTYEPIYGDPMAADPGIKGNYAISTLPKVDASIEDNADTTEGQSVTSEQLTREFFTGTLGFVYGNDTEEPWSQTGDVKCPRLYFETGLLLADPLQATINKGDSLTITVTLYGEELTEDMLGGFTLDFNEAVLENTNMEAGENCVILTFKGLADGATDVTVGLNGQQVKTSVTVKDPFLGVGSVTDSASAIRYDGTAVYAAGSIKVYSLQGVLVAEGAEAVNVTSLPAGIYVATAATAQGKQTLKFTRR